MKGKSTTNKKKYSNTSYVNSGNNKMYLLPLIFIAAILPFIMRSYQFDAGLGSFTWFSEDATRVDVFLFYKQVYLLITCSIMLLLIFYKVSKGKIKPKLSPSLVPIIIYGVLALVSTIFSDYPKLGVSGVYEQFESIFVILSYCLIVYYAFLFIQSEEDVRFILHYLLFGVLAIGALGFLQAVGLDPIANDFVKKIYLSRPYWDYLDKFTPSFGLHRVYLTLYNPNYVGSYAGLLIPLMLGLLITNKDKKRIVLYILALVGLTISLFASQSDTGVISLVVALLFIAIFFRKYIFKKPKIVLPVIGVGALLAIVVIAVNFNTIKNTVNGVFNIQKSAPTLTDIKTEEELTITYKGNDLKISFLYESDMAVLLLNDKDYNTVSYTVNETGSYIVDDERFAGIQVSGVMYNEVICLVVNIDGKDWVFSNQLGDNTYYYLNSSGKFDKIITSDSAVFTGYETLASGRGYIWSRTLPLLKDNIFLGTGADTFVTAFPQQDYVDLYNSGFDGQLLTRPHSMFLQIGVQSGVLSLIAFLVFYGMYFISSIRLYLHGTFNTYLNQVGVSIFIGTIAYMITGITNDSTITVAPVFWVLIGIGVAINHRLKTSKEM